MEEEALRIRIQGHSHEKGLQKLRIMTILDTWKFRISLKNIDMR